jgi:hypothetical protein
MKTIDKVPKGFYSPNNFDAMKKRPLITGGKTPVALYANGTDKKFFSQHGHNSSENPSPAKLAFELPPRDMHHPRERLGNDRFKGNSMSLTPLNQPHLKMTSLTPRDKSVSTTNASTPQHHTEGESSHERDTENTQILPTQLSSSLSSPTLKADIRPANNDANAFDVFMNRMQKLTQKNQLPNYEPTRFSDKSHGIVKGFGVCTNQGLIRNYNEDRVAIVLNILRPPNKPAHEYWPNCSFFGVYDGHGGNKCAEFLRNNLHQYRLSEVNTFLGTHKRH